MLFQEKACYKLCYYSSMMPYLKRQENFVNLNLLIAFYHNSLPKPNKYGAPKYLIYIFSFIIIYNIIFDKSYLLIKSINKKAYLGFSISCFF